MAAVLCLPPCSPLGSRRGKRGKPSKSFCTPRVPLNNESYLATREETRRRLQTRKRWQFSEPAKMSRCGGCGGVGCGGVQSENLGLTDMWVWKRWQGLCEALRGPWARLGTPRRNFIFVDETREANHLNTVFSAASYQWTLPFLIRSLLGPPGGCGTLIKASTIWCFLQIFSGKNLRNLQEKKWSDWCHSCWPLPALISHVKHLTCSTFFEWLTRVSFEKEN